MMMDAAQDLLPTRRLGHARRPETEICGSLWHFFGCTMVPRMLLVAAIVFMVYQILIILKNIILY
jgi:hypothetical protein